MASLIKYFGLDKIVTLRKIIAEHGGVRGSLYKLYRMEELRTGTLIGTDCMGNKYFENNNYFFGRNRWVEYSPAVGTDYDASQVDARWYGWLHYKTDRKPSEHPGKNYPWISQHTQNLTGTSKAYVPYSTTKPKIEAWVPGKKETTAA